jgi:hypothetical protein
LAAVVAVVMEIVQAVVVAQENLNRVLQFLQMEHILLQ